MPPLLYLAVRLPIITPSLCLVLDYETLRPLSDAAGRCRADLYRAVYLCRQLYCRAGVPVYCVCQAAGSRDDGCFGGIGVVCFAAAAFLPQVVRTLRREMPSLFRPQRSVQTAFRHQNGLRRFNCAEAAFQTACFPSGGLSVFMLCSKSCSSSSSNRLKPAFSRASRFTYPRNTNMS